MSRDNPVKLLQDPQSLNLYAYARNNPLKYVDVDGRSFEEFMNKMKYGIYTSDKRISEMERMSLEMDKSGGQYLVSPDTGKYYSNRKNDLALGGMSTCFMGTFCGEQPINPKDISPSDLSEKQLLHNRQVIADKAADFAMMVGGMSGATVLGKYPEYIKLADDIGAKSFNVPSNIWKNMSGTEKWVANQKFLDRMIMRDDKIILSTPVLDINKISGTYRQELDYLIGKGYKLNSQGTQLIK